MLKLLFIRHGESTGNRDRRMAGHSADELTPAGHDQCQRLAHRLHQRSWPPTHVYASPLRRSLLTVSDLLPPWGWSLVDATTAEIGDAQLKPAETSAAWRFPTIVEQHHSVEQPPPQLMLREELAEFQAGILTGLTWSEATQQYPDLCHTLVTSQDWVAIPGAETPLQGRARASSYLQHILSQHQNGDALWIISHHWIMEHLVACLMGAERTWKISIPNTALFEFWIDRDRWFQTGMSLGISDRWQIKRFSDCYHLEPVSFHK